MRKIPLRKCLQCHTMKREDFHDRCQACYDENEADIVRQIESGITFPLDRNLIGWVYATSQPGLHDYLWYFLKWCFWCILNYHSMPEPRFTPRADPPFVKDEYIEADRPYRFANDGTPIYGYQPRIDPNRAHVPPPQSITSDMVVGAPIGRYNPGLDTWEPAPYVKDEYEDNVWYTKDNTNRRGITALLP